MFVASTLPKSGSHLLMQLVSPIAERKVWVRTNEFGGWSVKKHPLYYAVADILLLRNGMAMGHIWYDEDLADFIQWRELPMIFLRRDLRDLVVSEAYHVENESTEWIHPMKEELATLPSHRERLRAVMPLVLERWNGFKGWCNEDWVLQLTFEELIHTPKEASQKIIDYLQVEDVTPEDMIAAVNPETSQTFRSGKTGNWKEEFDDGLLAEWEDLYGERT